MQRVLPSSTQCISRLLARSRCPFKTPAVHSRIACGSAVFRTHWLRRLSSVAASASAMAPTKAMELFEPETLLSTALSAATPQAWQGDLLILAVTEEDFVNESDVVSIKSDALKALDADFGAALSEIVAEGGFEGKQGSSSKVLRVGAAPAAAAKYVAMVGLGKAAKLSTLADWGPSAFQALGAAAGTLAKANKSKAVGLAFASPLPAGVDPSTLAQQVTAGALLGGYETTRFKSKKSPTASRLEALHILGHGPGSPAAAGLAKGHAVASGTLLTRYLVEAPPNVCTPTHLANAAVHIAARFPERMTCKVLDKAECEALGMGSFIAVAEASDEPLKFIHLTYSPPASASGAAPKKVAVIGKGLTFDSGGYNIKAGAGSMIELMKFDMGGSGATLGAARIVAEVQPAGVEVHFIVAACENMVAGRGMRPGDVLTAASGKTIEVNNTDAEGRLTLADALWYAQEKCGVTAIVDSATLTGACMVALGPDIGGLFTPSDKMAEALSAAAKAAGEKFWRLPMEEKYWESMKSSIADMKNTGGRLGGAITAALFLKQFVRDDVEWAHLDMAGPVWDEKAGLPTGFGAATLAEWVLGQAPR